ncbi:MAG: hypothetical protein LQ338_005549 [Usnochroma carphineum]|nr:MAG: hypothetical protein LQ338_005549 [Usnochroma carphineum]
MEGLYGSWLRTDAARERELFRYFDPPQSTPATPTKATQPGLSIDDDDSSATSTPSSPETTLTALAQLCALRLDASRAIVSVISKETQYFIAEATKTLDLVDNQSYDEEGDALWLGCGSVDKSGRLCEKTIELTPSPDAYPCFTVTDLSQDERFNQLPFVTGPPHFRFYAGTPLTTRNGINVGSLFIIDDKVRPRLSPAQEKFLGTIAATIMGHMEANRESRERKKVLRMAKGLNAFVEGKGSFETGDTSDGSTPYESADDAPDGAGSAYANIESAHKATFSRAASLLNESLNLRDHGGVCFLDTIIGPRNLALKRTESKETESESDAKESPRKGRQVQGRIVGSLSHDTLPGESMDRKVAKVISSSCSMPQPGPTTAGPVKDSFIPLEERFVQSLLKHYPRGNVWMFDGIDGLTSEEDDVLSPTVAAAEEKRRRRRSRRQLEMESLRKCFPGESELQFVIAFGNSIMAEISRLASLYESRQKGDFIGSISHELRSPLHGILGSAEFLLETNFDTFQRSLVDTVSSCGRTLLDTIEHILDFSKINSFERNWRNARKPIRSSKNEAARRAVAQEAPPMMSIYAVTDVAAIVEEVVEGVYAGSMYRDFGSAGITEVSAGQRGKTTDRGLAVDNKSLLGDSVEQRGFKDIEVVLDIETGDYCFTTQPGALRRVVMNVFGNSLKYTSAGRITVKLKLDGPEILADENSKDENSKDKNKILNITITDTGRGISNDYLRTSLYTAFSQEDALANGTGLGLSIVRSIVTMLEGTIDIKSQLGQGTEVHIRIPLSREASGATPVSTPSSAGSLDQLRANSISVLQDEYTSKKISIYEADLNNIPEQEETETETKRMVSYYVEKWYKMAIEPLPLEKTTDVIIVEEAGLPDLLKQLRPGPAIVVLCRTHRLQAAQSLYSGAIEFMSRPFGPYKLARAIRLSLEKSKDIATGFVPQPEPTIHSPLGSDTEAIFSKFESITVTTDDEETPVQVHTNGVISAAQSSNAQIALGSNSSGASTENRGDFPFPAQDINQSGSDSPCSAFGDMMQQHSSRPKLSSRKTEPVFRPRSPFTSTLTRQGALATSDAREKSDEAAIAAPAIAPEPSQTKVQENPQPILSVDGTTEKRPPRLLLVDDNKINLRLLETFMRKRKYKSVDLAEDGSAAVEAAKKHKQGYDIIFMDLSMPVMNGFEATHAIRELEKTRDPASKPAMIVALTGLASGRDHGEAFACGVDLYMTKPVSFKEVGRLLSNWEAHGGLDAAQASSGAREQELPSSNIQSTRMESTSFIADRMQFSACQAFLMDIAFSSACAAQLFKKTSRKRVAHIKEQNYGADWGDYVSFTRHMKHKAGNLGVDLLLVDTGDLHDGNGLSDASTPNGAISNPIFENVEYDLLTIGNHELYVTDIAYETFNQFSKVYGDRYITSNVQITNPATGALEYIGSKYRYFTTDHGLRIMAFGVLYDFTGNSNVSKVIKARDLVKEGWFLDAVNYAEPIDIFVLLGHNPVRTTVSSSTFGIIYNAIRGLRPDVPIQAFGGHTHIRDFVVYDALSTGLESGRYCETLGWASMSGINSSTSKGNQKPRGVPNPTRKAVKLSNVTSTATSPFATSDLVYSRRYLDWNRLTFEYHATGSQDSTFDYHSGQRVTADITQDRKQLNLTALYGCAPETYCQSCKPFGADGNIFGLLQTALAAIVVNESRADVPRLIIINTGSIRFDLVKGPFTFDDSFIVSPFQDAFQFIPDVPYNLASQVLGILNAGSFQKRSTGIESQDLSTRDFDFSNPLIPSDACTALDDKQTHSQSTLRRRTEPLTRNLRNRQSPALTPGYTTTDDFGTDGDDTPHSKIPFYPQPNDVQANASFPASGLPKTVDLVFLDFIGLGYVIPALSKLGGNYSAADVSYYLPKTFTTNSYLPEYARRYWQAGVPNCPVGDGVGSNN